MADDVRSAPSLVNSGQCTHEPIRSGISPGYHRPVRASAIEHGKGNVFIISLEFLSLHNKLSLTMLKILYSRKNAAARRT